MTKEPKKKRHYSWWPYIREIVQLYPCRCGVELSRTEKIAQDAVKTAIDITYRMPDGADRMKLIRLLHWSGNFTVQGAANAIPCEERTAYRWQLAFFKEVARNRDMID